jgi:hypothetical protein
MKNANPAAKTASAADPQRQRDCIGPVEPAIETGDGPMRNTQQEDEVETQPWRVAARPHAFPGEVLVDQEEACYRDRGEAPR